MAEVAENCPLCLEKYDHEDISFLPCKCGYHVCMFCWHRIKSENGLCPLCKVPYSDEPVQYVPQSKTYLEEKKEEERQQKRRQKENKKIEEEQMNMLDMKIIQKNVMFVSGLPIDLTDSQLLKKKEYFGKFGDVRRVALNKPSAQRDGQADRQSARIEFFIVEDTVRAIKGINDGESLYGKSIKASLSSTKYCEMFVKKLTCEKRFCPLLHEYADKQTCFTKDDMAKKKHIAFENQLFAMYGKKEEVKQADPATVRVAAEANVASNQAKVETQIQSKSSKKRQAKNKK